MTTNFRITHAINDGNVLGPHSFVSTSNPTYPTAPPSAPTRCQTVGHRVVSDEDVIQYRDGVTVAYCGECGDRIQFGILPMGILAPQAKDLVDRVASGEESDDLLAEYAALLEHAQEAGARYAELLDSLALLAGLVQQKWS